MTPTIEYATFIHKDHFTEDFTEAQFNAALDYLETRFVGVQNSFWLALPDELRQKKINCCFSDLMAWYIADTYPSEAIAVAGTGGMPLLQKTIGGVAITYKNSTMVKGALDFLNTNLFGIRARTQMESAPELYMIF